MPAISIILPTVNRPLLLQRAVASVRAQTERDFELLLVDSGGNGQPSWRASVQALNDLRLKIVAAPGARNAAGARNAGLAAATGGWITFLDDDDAYAPTKIAAQLALATAARSPLVLCGARFHLRGRTRIKQVATTVISGDALLTDAGLGMPLLFHQRSLRVRFDETLSAGEDIHYAHRLLADLDLTSVPNVPEPLVDVYQDEPVEGRTNLRGEENWRAARRVWWEFGGRFSAGARRLFVLRAMVARAKLLGHTRGCASLAPAVLRAGGMAQGRFLLNALLVSVAPGRRWFVT